MAWQLRPMAHTWSAGRAGLLHLLAPQGWIEPGLHQASLGRQKQSACFPAQLPAAAQQSQRKEHRLLAQLLPSLLPAEMGGCMANGDTVRLPEALTPARSLPSCQVWWGVVFRLQMQVQMLHGGADADVDLRLDPAKTGSYLSAGGGSLDLLSRG